MKFNWLNRLRFKYKIILLDERTLSQKLTFRLSAISAISALAIFTIVAFSILAGIIFFTPLKLLLPGYGDVSVRELAVAQSERVDSLSQELLISSRQMDVIKSIIQGEILIDSVSTDSIRAIIADSLMLEASEAELAFVADYEEQNAYDIDGDLKSMSHPKAKILIPPVRGSIVQGFAPDSGRLGILLLSEPRSPILAVEEGTILMTDYNQNLGYSIVVQHSDGLISIYRQTGMPLRGAGYKVITGEALAFTGWASDENKSPQLYFELWDNGMPINPIERISF